MKLLDREEGDALVSGVRWSGIFTWREEPKSGHVRIDPRVSDLTLIVAD